MRKFEWQYSAVAYLVLAAYTLGQWNVVFSYASNSADALNPSQTPEIALTIPSPPASTQAGGSSGSGASKVATPPSTALLSFQATPQAAVQDTQQALVDEMNQTGVKQQQQELARIAYLRHLPETLNVMPKLETSDIEASTPKELRFRTVFNDVKNEAGFYVNDHEVFRFRSSLGLLTPYLRSKQVARRLYESLETANAAQKLVLKKTSSTQYDLYLGDVIITTIDADTAKASKQPLATLANVWMDELEEALGSVVLPSQQPVVKAEPAKQETATQQQDDGATGRYAGAGMASWYGPGFHGRTCADGSRYNMYAMTAAHKTLPFGTRVRVTNQANGKTCIVRITDRGPYAHGRVIDLSKAAAQSIGAVATGVARVSLEIIN
jgi:rare lipoprotein A (peptidoglycan hydrolase)